MLKLNWVGEPPGACIGRTHGEGEAQRHAAFAIWQTSRDSPYQLAVYPVANGEAGVIARAWTVEELKLQAQQELERRHPLEALAAAGEEP